MPTQETYHQTRSNNNNELEVLGSGSQLEILSERTIGGGIFGNTSEIVCRIGGQEVKFVKKKFIGIDAENNAKRASQKYWLLRNAGLKVWNTYRLGKDQASVLMTSGFTDDYLCVGSNDGSNTIEDTAKAVDYKNAKLMTEIANLDSLLESMATQIRIATEHSLLIDRHAYLFLVATTNYNELDFIIGDYDDVARSNLTASALHTNNIFNAQSALENFVKNNLATEGYRPIILKIRRYLDGHQ